MWCFAHRRHEPDNDLIDFPVSPTFLNHYHFQGLTPRSMPEALPSVNTPARCTCHEEMSELRAEIETLKYPPALTRPQPKPTQPQPKRSGGVTV